MKEWKDLSIYAKSIIEWVESPITDKKLEITVDKNKMWFMKCPAWSGDVSINITDSIFNEIKDYISYGKDIKVIESSEERLIFTLADDVNLY